jgi:hypothetical protein
MPSLYETRAVHCARPSIWSPAPNRGFEEAGRDVAARCARCQVRSGRPWSWPRTAPSENSVLWTLT